MVMREAARGPRAAPVRKLKEQREGDMEEERDVVRERTERERKQEKLDSVINSCVSESLYPASKEETGRDERGRGETDGRRERRRKEGGRKGDWARRREAGREGREVRGGRKGGKGRQEGCGGETEVDREGTTREGDMERGEPAEGDEGQWRCGAADTREELNNEKSTEEGERH
eukprot:6205419-Pleurochrysis_carterae.AAC.1